MTQTDRNRHDLIEQMEWRYLQRAWSDMEMADELDTDRTNIYKIRVNVMEARMQIPFIEEGRGKWRIDKTNYVPNIRLNPEEALALYLGGRRLQQQTKTGQTAVATALQKLAQALRKPLAEKLVQAADVILNQEQDKQQTHVFQLLMKSWLNGRRVRIKHRKPHGELRTYTVSPYQLEPSIWGDGVYLIGSSDYHNNNLATFKLSRIEEISETSEPFTVPDNFDSHTLLQHAWGIWHADEKPVVVRLKFSQYVTPRVKESIWHPSQTIQDPPEGGCIWQAEIAEWREMVPWVRGWGSDVEVLEPEELRQSVIHTAEKLGEKYHVRPPAQRHPYQWLYAKTDRKNPENIHLLLYHLIDVGQVALTMWDGEVLPISFRNHIAQQLQVTVDQAGRFVAFIASLHDLGKASPSYQKKYSPPWLKEKLAEVGFVLEDPRGYSPETNDKKTSHAHVTTWALPPLLVKYCGLDVSFARKIAQALGGHHGAWPINSLNFNFDDKTCPQWDIARHELIWELRNVFQPPPILLSPTEGTLNIFLTLISGLTSVADWLGSRDDKQSFPLVKELLTTREYVQRSKAQAKSVLHDLGWTGWQPNHALLDFETMFQYLDKTKPAKPRPVQQQIIDLTADLTSPSLTIIEAPTGIGKTEIAFYLADTLLQKHQGRGLYVAMPTQATSNQMYDRTAEFLKQRYPQNIVNLQLAHGQAALNDQAQEITLQTIGDDQEDGRIVAMSWFNEKSKRTLLAPFGVGTVDQTLMSVLQTKHFFVRLLGLSHKVIIFDEVHAYDTYMNTLFVQLLQWLRAIGTSVIMLSATLPAKTRQEFVYAFTDKRPNLDNHYPALTIASLSQPAKIHKLPSPEDVTLEINWLEAEKQLDHILTLAQKGGCIAVICNTVARSQTIFRQLLDARKQGKLDIEQDNLILFHARFPPIWRKEIEDKTKRLFGKPQEDEAGNLIDYRPVKGPAIIVATQVIEQSLDLDFDAMITDLAPIDLLIQRAGRLHRHKIRDNQRHGNGRQLTIILPKLDEQSIPHFDSDEYIYERYILLRTYRALHQLTINRCITLPGQTIDLIEAVYSLDNSFQNENINWQTALKEAHQKMRQDRHESQQKAKTQIAGKPEDEMLLYDTNLGLEEDNPAIHQTFQAKTRDIGPTLSLICLHAAQKENHVLLDPKDASTSFDLTTPPDIALTKKLLHWQINVQQCVLLNHFLVQDPPPAWRKNSILRHARVVIFQDSQYQFADKKNVYTLSLSRDYGVELKNNTKEVQ